MVLFDILHSSYYHVGMPYQNYEIVLTSYIGIRKQTSGSSTLILVSQPGSVIMRRRKDGLNFPDGLGCRYYLKKNFELVNRIA